MRTIRVVNRERLAMQAGDPDGARPGEPAHRGELPSEPVQMKTTSAAAERVHHALVEPDLSNDNACLLYTSDAADE